MLPMIVREVEVERNGGVPPEGKPLTLVFLHYLGGSHRTWAEVTERLQPHYRCIAVDLPGFGDAAEAAGYSVESMAAAVEAAVAPLGVGRLAIVGHSMGGKIAAVLAARARDGVAGALHGLEAMVLVAPSPPSQEPMPGHKREQMLDSLGTRRGADEDTKAAEQFVNDNLASQLPEPIQQRTVQDVLRANPAAWRAWLTGGSTEDWSAAVGVLPYPALVLTGGYDAALGTSAQRELTLPHLAHGVLQELPACSHLIPLEAPEACAAMIRSFLTSLDPQHDSDGQQDASPAELERRYAALIASSHTAPSTREVLTARWAENAGRPQSFSEEEMATLRALFGQILPQIDDGRTPVDLAARFDAQVAADQGDGWRYDSLPPDLQAWRTALALLDEQAQHRAAAGFATAHEHIQHALLSVIASGQLRSPRLDLQRWFEDARAAATRLYLAHPATRAQIGYSGPFDEQGFVQIGVGQREAWEPATHQPAATAEAAR